MSATGALPVLVSVAAAAVSAVLMEYWSRFLHGRVWHRALWRIHRSHHRTRIGRFETNDLLSITHAPIAAAAIVIGCIMHGWTGAILRGIGSGMTAFGIAYVVVHDGLVHGRMPAAWLVRFRFFRRIRGAHRVHHRTGGPPYGLFAGPSELAHRRQVTAPARRAAQRRLLPRPSARSTSR